MRSEKLKQRSTRSFGFVGLTRLDQPIYRVMSHDRFLESLRRRTLTLVHPARWDDPFEAVLLSGVVVLKGSNMTLSMHDLRRQLYGQCWTTMPESDALWRIYSPDKDGVMVSTTPRRLLDAARRAVAGHEGAGACVGVVGYHEETALARMMRNRTLVKRMLSSPDIRELSRSFLIKRTAFSHEAEVRLILRVQWNGKDRLTPLRRVPIKPNAFYRSVVVDPRANERYVARLRREVDALGFHRRITMSKLYQLPDLNVRVTF